MKALRWHKRADVRLEEVDDAPAPRANEIRVAVEWCGICGTDVEEFTSGPIVIPTQPHPLTGFHAPIVIGHEVSARVTDVGKDVCGLSPGQLVGLDGSFFCGSCAACKRHELNLCERWAFIGMSHPGGLAESMTVPAYMAIPVPESIPAEQIALAETFSVATRAVRRGRLAEGETAAVFGAGAVGLAVLQVALAAGAQRVTVIDPIAARRSKALQLGADKVLDATENVVAILHELEHGGPDLVFDCTGSSKTPGLAVLSVRPGGRVLQLGLPPLPCEVNLLQLAVREVELLGCIGHVYDQDYRKAIELIVAGRVNAEALITHRLPLKEAVPCGLQALANSSLKEAIKVLISPRQR